jgi:hypothetical protein
MKNSVFWDVSLCSRTYVNLRFVRTYHLHFQGRNIRERRTRLSRLGESAATCSLADFSTLKM